MNIKCCGVNNQPMSYSFACVHSRFLLREGRKWSSYRYMTKSTARPSSALRSCIQQVLCMSCKGSYFFGYISTLDCNGVNCKAVALTQINASLDLSLYIHDCIIQTRPFHLHLAPITNKQQFQGVEPCAKAARSKTTKHTGIGPKNAKVT
jgi:hypothetical protein